MRYIGKAKHILKRKGLDIKDISLRNEVVRALPRFYGKPSNFLKNNLFYLTASQADDIKNGILKELEQEIIVQEFNKLYNLTYKAEYESTRKNIKGISEKAIGKIYPDAINAAKIEFFKSRFNDSSGKGVGYVSLNIRNEALDSKNKFADISTMAYVQREVNANPTFVLNVVKAIEKGDVLNRTPNSIEEKIAKEYLYNYNSNFNLSSEVAHQVAQQKATKAVLNHYENLEEVVTEKKVKTILAETEKLLEQELNLGERFHKGMGESSPYVIIAQRIDKINKRILGNYKQAIYNDSMGFVEKSVFNNINIAQFEQRNLSKKYKAVDFPLVMKKYSKDIKQVMDNNNSIAKLEKDITAINNINEKNTKEKFGSESFQIELSDKKEKMRFYKIRNELIFNKIEINEMQEAVRNITGGLSVRLVEENKQVLNNRKVDIVLSNINKFIKVAPKDFEKQLRKSMKMSAKTFNSVSYDRLLDGIKYFIVEKDKLKKTKEEKIANAETIVNTINEYIENVHRLPNSGSKKYQDQINSLRLELAVKRFAELSKAANDLTVLSRIYEHQLEQVNEREPNAIIRDDKVLNAENIQGQINIAYNEINAVLQMYAGSQQTLSAFVREFVQGIRVEIANTPSPKVKRNLLNAYAEPLLRSSIIKNSGELTKIVEDLAKRENFFFMKSHEELANQQDVVNIKDSIVGELNYALGISAITKQPNVQNSRGTTISGLIGLNNDATKFATNKVLISRLRNFSSLNGRDKIEVLNNAELENDGVKTGSPINYSRFVLNPAGLEKEAKRALSKVIKDNQKILNKYKNTNDQDKINFLILSMHRENTEETFKMRSRRPAREHVKKHYNLENEQELNDFKEDLFWKIQYKAIEKKSKNNTLLPKSSGKLAEVSGLMVKLFDVAGNDIQGMPNDNEVSFKKLARQSLLSYSESELNSAGESGVVEYVLKNSYNYYKTGDFNSVINKIASNKEIAKNLKRGRVSLEELIENESGKKGLLNKAISEILNKTSVKEQANTQKK